MEFETKFDIGNRVFVLDVETNKIVVREVAEILVKVIGSKISPPSIFVSYGLDFRLPHNPNRDVMVYEEEKCFKIKQDLIDSL